jgi:hypothetical protein
MENCLRLLLPDIISVHSHPKIKLYYEFIYEQTQPKDFSYFFQSLLFVLSILFCIEFAVLKSSDKELKKRLIKSFGGVMF